MEEPKLSKTPEEFAFEQGIVNEITEEKAKKEIKVCFEAIRILIMKYLDIDEKYIDIIALWAIGTYFHKEFESYPFLFINAMRGSGKTRLLKLLESLVKDGKITNNLSEAVLFRTAERNTLLIDEFESINSKDKTALKELLQSGYKKGSKVERMKKNYSKEGEQMIVEKFNVYTPVVMANIKGIDDTLGDRCITILLEKSVDKSRTKLIEDFSKSSYIHQLKTILQRISVCSVGVYPIKNMYIWNTYIYTTYTNTLTTLPTLYTQKENENDGKSVIDSETLELFRKIDGAGVDGRNLELFFPLFVIAEIIGKEILDRVLEVAKDIVGERRKDEFAQSLDVSVIDFVSKKESSIKYHSIKELATEFKLFVDVDANDDELNNKWMGNALRRLNLVTDKRRVSKGMEVILNVSKAVEKIKIFKEPEVKGSKSEQEGPNSTS